MKILYFSTARVATGRESEEIVFGADVSGDEVWAELVGRHASLASLRPGARLARNDEYAGTKSIFTDEDVVAVIPPVSGG